MNLVQADPAQILNVPVVPLGALLSAAYPLSSSPPYVLSWLVDLISAPDMMHPELLKKLVLNNFCEYRCLSYCYSGWLSLLHLYVTLSCHNIARHNTC